MIGPHPDDYVRYTAKELRDEERLCERIVRGYGFDGHGRIWWAWKDFQAFMFNLFRLKRLF